MERLERVVLPLILMLCLVGSAQAAPTMFDFEGATIGGYPDIGGSANQYVSSYMTGAYGSSVTSTGAAAWRNAETAPVDLDWTGKTPTDQWLRSYGAVGYTQTPGKFQISFDDVALAQAEADFYVFTATLGDDFTVKAYDSTYGDRYAPNAGALVYEESWDLGTGPGSFSLNFASPVSLLVFSDTGYYDVAIDNLQVTPVPAPSALLLGLFGVGIVRAKLRKRA